LHLAGGPLPTHVLLKVAHHQHDPVARALSAWVDAGLLHHSLAKDTVDWAHDLLREEPLNWLDQADQAELATAMASLLPEDQLRVRAHLLLRALSVTTVDQGAGAVEELRLLLMRWTEVDADGDALEDFCFRLMEQEGLPWSLQEPALQCLCRREARQHHRARWLRLLRKVDWTRLGATERRHLTDSVAATLDHNNAMGETEAWLSRLDALLEPELRATLRLDLAMNRLLKNDRRGAAPLVNGALIRQATRDPARLAQLELLELFLATDVVAEPSLWLSRLESFHEAQGARLDIWSRDRLILQIVDAASRARDGEAMDRWQERAIESVKDVARHDPPALGRARVARRLMFFGRSHGSIPDLLAAADWYLARGNLRMALPDLDAAATTHYRHGEVAEALDLLKGVEGLLLGARLEFTTAAFRINAYAPFLAGGDWPSAQRWLEGLNEVVAAHAPLQPFYAYSRLQVMERRGRSKALGAEEDRLFSHLAAEQLALGALGGQRQAELQALAWVQDARRGRAAPDVGNFRAVLSALEGHNIQPRPDSLSQLAEAALLFSRQLGGEWLNLALEVESRLNQCDVQPCHVLRPAQMARLAHMQGDRVRMRDLVLRAAVEAWEARLPQWLVELAAYFPKVRLEGLVADQSRDRMSPDSRLAWMELLEHQAQPGPRFRAFGIDLSAKDPRVLLESQVERIGRELPRWRRESDPSAQNTLDRLEQRALSLQARLPELPDHRGGIDEPVGLVMHLSGTLRVWLRGEELPSDRLGGGRFRELFVFLVLERWRHPGRPWSSRDLVRHIWGRSGDATRQMNSLYVYISQLKGLLRQTGFPDCLERSEGGYCLHRDCPVELDVQHFEQTMERHTGALQSPLDKSGRANLTAAARSCARVLDPTLHGHWVDELRAWHEQRWFTLVDRLLATTNKAMDRKALVGLRRDFYPD